MMENNPDFDMRTNCPYCKIDINAPEHDNITCLHQSYAVYIEARARIQAIEDGLQTGDTPEMGIVAPPERRIRKWERIRWAISDTIRIIRDFAIVIAILRFILFGLGV